MSEDITLTLEKREVLGKAVKHLRREGKVPAVIHDHGKESLHVMAPYLEVVKAYQIAGKHHPVSLKVGSIEHLALIKDVDFDPKKHQLRHVVFNAINQNEAVEAEVPIMIIGDIPAEMANLMVLKTLDHVTVEALPKDLPDELIIEGSRLAEIGDRVTVADLGIPDGVTIKDDPEQMIAVVEEPRIQEEEPEVEEETEGEEGASVEAGEESAEAADDSKKESGEEE